MIFQFAAWLPDLPPLNNPGSLVVLNVLPAGQNAYSSFPLLEKAASFSAIGQVLGGYYARDNANNTYTYVGDASALYVQSTTTFAKATNLTSAPYAVAVGDAWEFVSWGQTVIAVDGNSDYPQQISLGAANFVSITAAPKARHIAVINNFVVLGNISDSATQVQRVRWSAINNSALWSQDATTLSDLQDLVGNGGWIQKIIGGEQGGYVFQERAIWNMVFVGSPLIFQFTKLQDGIGAYIAQSVVNYENIVWFIANDGFKQFDGTNITPIGENQVDITFFADLDVGFLQNVRGLVIPDKKIVMWAYPGVGNIGGRANKIIVYSWAYSRWSLIVIPVAYSSGVDIITMSSTPGYTLDGLDAVDTNLDTLQPSLDSRVWTGGQLVASAYINGALYYFNGPPMPAEVQTGETNLMANTPFISYQKPKAALVKNKATVTEIWPVADGASLSSVTVTAYVRDQLNQTASALTALTPNSQGYCEANFTSRYVRFDVQTSGAFDFLQGVDVTFVNAGVR